MPNRLVTEEDYKLHPGISRSRLLVARASVHTCGSEQPAVNGMASAPAKWAADRSSGREGGATPLLLS